MRLVLFFIKNLFYCNIKREVLSGVSIQPDSTRVRWKFPYIAFWRQSISKNIFQFVRICESWNIFLSLAKDKNSQPMGAS